MEAMREGMDQMTLHPTKYLLFQCQASQAGRVTVEADPMTVAADLVSVEADQGTVPAY